MRIVTYLPALESCGGVELNLVETARELAARGHRICLLYEHEGNLAGELRSVCDSLQQIPSPRYSEVPLRDALRVGRCAVGASLRRPDVVYAHNISELAWAAGVRALTRAPVVCHLHEFKPVRRSSLRLWAGMVDRFVVGSSYQRRAWTNHGLPPARTEVIHPGLSQSTYPQGTDEDRRHIRRQLGLPPDGYVALYMGRLIPEKGIDVLLEAWRALGLPPEQARLLIVGLPATTDDYIDRLRTMAPSGCDWLPMRRAVVPMLHAADVLVLPSRWDEPFGRVVIEAMATGRPAVAAAVGGIPEILRGEFSGLLFPRGDAAALADRLRTLQCWRQENPALAARCADHVAEHFSLDAFVSALERVFESARAG